MNVFRKMWYRRLGLTDEQINEVELKRFETQFSKNRWCKHCGGVKTEITGSKALQCSVCGRISRDRF